MTPAEIRAAIQARGTTINQLSADHGLRRNALATSLTHKYRQPKHHRIIADFIGLALWKVWPDLYRPGEEPRFRRGMSAPVRPAALRSDPTPRRARRGLLRHRGGARAAEHGDGLCVREAQPRLRGSLG
jgi:lambda repressor-like predicted transcriptional regulator